MQCDEPALAAPSFTRASAEPRVAATRIRLRIGQLAELLGTTTKTLRFYESIGLLRPAVRSESGYRLYDRAGVDRARLVIGLRRLDLTIPELQELVREDPRTTLRQRMLVLMDEKLREIFLQLSVLEGRRDDLAARHEALLATPRDRPPQCICDALFAPCHCKGAPVRRSPERQRARKVNRARA